MVVISHRHICSSPNDIKSILGDDEHAPVSSSVARYIWLSWQSTGSNNFHPSSTPRPYSVFPSAICLPFSVFPLWLSGFCRPTADDTNRVPQLFHHFTFPDKSFLRHHIFYGRVLLASSRLEQLRTDSVEPFTRQITTNTFYFVFLPENRSTDVLLCLYRASIFNPDKQLVKDRTEKSG